MTIDANGQKFGDEYENRRIYAAKPLFSHVADECGALCGGGQEALDEHWQLDVTFGEDGARARKDTSPPYMKVLRKRALSMLNRANLCKRVSLRRKISRAAMDDRVLQSVVFWGK